MQMNMPKLIAELQENYSAFIFLPFSQLLEIDILLVLNACPTSCASLPPFFGETIIVTPESIDFWPYNSTALQTEITHRLCMVYYTKYRRYP